MREDLVHDRAAGGADLVALGREAMLHRAPRPRDAFDQAPVDHASSQRPEGLVGLEGQLGQLVKGGVRFLVQVAQGVPLDDGDPQLG